MEAIEIIAIVIIVIAILILVYYYLLNSNPEAVQKLRSYVPSSADAHMDEILGNNSDYNDLEKEDDSESMTKRIKVKLSDIDMSALNTDAFSNKIDAFLNEKSEDLINEWSLATTNDLDELESKFSKTTKSVDELEKDYNDFKKSSQEFQINTTKKLEDLDKRIEELENS